MKAEIEQELGRLVGRSIERVTRAADLLRLHLADRSSGNAAIELHVACPWRLTEGERLLVGSGDLLTPADAEADLETFDWDEPGSNWMDVRLAELWEGFGGTPPLVQAVAADALGGFRLTLEAGRGFEVFPTSTPTGHVSTEFWRIVPNDGSTPAFAVGTFGIEREAGV